MAADAPHHSDAPTSAATTAPAQRAFAPPTMLLDPSLLEAQYELGCAHAEDGAVEAALSAADSENEGAQ